MAVQSGTRVVQTGTRPPRRRHRAEDEVATLASRIAVPAGFVVMMVVAILVAFAGTALASPLQGRPAAASAADAETGPALRPRLPPAAGFARSEARARRVVGSICSGCASGPSRNAGPVHAAPARPAAGAATSAVAPSARSRGPTRYRVAAARQRDVVPR